MKIALFDYKVIATNPIGSCHLQLLRGLCDEHEFTVFAVEFENPDPTRIRWVRIPVPTRPLALLYATFHLVAPIVFLLHRLRERSEQFDLIHVADSNVMFGDVAYAHFCHRGFLETQWRAAKPPGVRGALRWLDHWLHSVAERRMFARMSKIVVPSQGLRRELELHYPFLTSKISVIPNPVDLGRLQRPPTFDREQMRRQIGCKPDDLVLLFVALGQFERKGLPVLLTALDSIGDGRVRLIVVGGERDLVTTYASRARRLGISDRVRFLGMQDDVRPFLWASDAMVFPSYYEVFPLVCNEAAAAQLPLIVAHVHGVEEFLVDGVNGFYVERTASSIGKAIERLLSLDVAERRTLGRRASEAVSGYGIGNFVASWASMYAPRVVTHPQRLDVSIIGDGAMIARDRIASPAGDRRRIDVGVETPATWWPLRLSSTWRLVRHDSRSNWLLHDGRNLIEIVALRRRCRGGLPANASVEDLPEFARPFRGVALPQLPRRARRMSAAVHAERSGVLAADEASLEDHERWAMAAVGRGWASLPSQHGARWAVPRGSRHAARTSLAIYHPVRPRALVGWQIARVFAGAGGFRLLPRGAPPSRAVREVLGGFLEQGWVVATSRSNHPAHPGRYVALLVDVDGGFHGIAKVATDEYGRAALEREVSNIERFGEWLQPPLAAPRILEHREGVVLFEAVEWQPRLAAWNLPPEVASVLGRFSRVGQSAHDVGNAHGDCAPWNLLRSQTRWVLVDWEDAHTDAPPFFDLCHYLVQSSVLLRRPNERRLVDGFVDGRGAIGETVAAYADGADTPVGSAVDGLRRYLQSSLDGLAWGNVAERSAIAARSRMLSRLT